MLKVKQSIGNTGATVMTSLHVLGREGSGEVGIPNIEATAGALCLYGHVQSKQAGVRADLKDCQAIWMNWLENEIEARYEAAGGGLEIIADVLQIGLKDLLRLSLACNVSEDRTLNSQPFAITKELSEHLRRCIEQLAVMMGLEHPDLTASAAVLVIEDTILRTQMTGSPEEAQTARLLFQCLQHA